MPEIPRLQTGVGQFAGGQLAFGTPLRHASFPLRFRRNGVSSLRWGQPLFLIAGKNASKKKRLQGKGLIVSVVVERRQKFATTKNSQRYGVAACFTASRLALASSTAMLLLRLTSRGSGGGTGRLLATRLPPSHRARFGLREPAGCFSRWRKAGSFYSPIF
jgi:hypothetical protein